ncbi:NmrA family protein [Apiospora hydei]|uniref:NmrA family protein n=1 Tax=Apiospora hydei TaxID=1337664 RepID=A0ABR1VUM4_9PEZI
MAVVGGTGAQCLPIVRDLAQYYSYELRALARDATSRRFRELQSYGAVEAGAEVGGNSSRTKAAAFTAGTYIEMAIPALTIMMPRIEEKDDEGDVGSDGVLTWRLPLGPERAVVDVALADYGYCIKWVSKHPDRAHGFSLEVTIDHITYDETARVFTAVTVTAVTTAVVPVIVDVPWMGLRVTLRMRTTWPPCRPGS